jgi:glutathione synthase/RimK-type ligase-like ATP-grasp enzyme
MLLKQCNTCIQKQKAYIQQYIFHAAGRYRRFCMIQNPPGT